jgi:hypothetical protein
VRKIVVIWLLLLLLGIVSADISNTHSKLINPAMNRLSIDPQAKWDESPNPAKIEQAATLINPTGFLQSEDTIKYDGPNTNGVGVSGGGTIWGAVRFTPVTSTPAVLCTLKSAIFYQRQPVMTSGWVIIHEAGTPTSPGAKIDSAPYTNTPGTWVRVNFPTPRVCSVGTDFWLDVKLTHASGQYPLGVDAGPSVTPERSFVSTDGTSWQSLPSQGLNYNWNIRAIVKFPLFGNDVGVDAVIAPGASYIVNTSMTPIARMKNYGVITQTNFPVVCSIVGAGGVVRYTDTNTVASLAPGDTIRVNFTAWTPLSSGLCSVIMRTNLVGDQNPTNDRAARTTDIGLIYESFTDTTFPPSGWTVYNFDGGTQLWKRNTTDPNSPPACAVCRWESSTLINNDWLITPRLGPLGPDDSLFFYFRAYSDANWETLLVRVSTDPDVGDTTHYTIIDLIATNSPVYTQKALSLSAFAGNQVYIAFHYTCLFKWRIYLDDISVRSYVTGIAENNPNPRFVTTLNAPKPNPVTNGSVKISFTLSEPTRIALKVYDASGRLVKALINTKLESGIYNYTWNGKDEANRNVACGIYFYTLETPKQNYTKKMIFTR